MPRQLPWVNRTTKQQPRPTKASRTASDIEDDFFDDTVPTKHTKGKGRALSPEEHLDSDSHHPRNTRKRRALSSSSPVAELSAPPTECMRMGISRFKLRDDEWMMVEDELLETAKLFTRHLHIAEYERLKKSIEQRKKGIGARHAVTRPVVDRATLSTEGSMKKKAEVQNEKQRKAFHDVFALPDDDNKPPGPAPEKTKERLPVVSASGDTDSDDLDAPLRPSKSTALDSTFSTPLTSNPSGPRTTGRASSFYTEPTLVSQRTGSRMKFPSSRRATPFDMLDDYLPGGIHLTTPLEARVEHKERAVSTTRDPLQPISIAKPSDIPDIGKTVPRSLQMLDERDSRKTRAGNEVSRETLGYLAKRKVGLAEKDPGNRKAVNIHDDVPTFLLD